MTIRDITRQLGKLGRRLAGDEQAERDRWTDPNSTMGQVLNAQLERQPLPRRLAAKAQQAEAQQLARGAAQVEQDRRITQAWADAIEALPAGLRSMSDKAFAALAEAEQQLSDKRRRLADLPSDGDDVWIGRRAQLTSAVEALEDLVTERTKACAQICRYSIPAQLDQVLAERITAADQAVADAELYYADLLARSKAEIGRLNAERTAIASVRAEAQSPIAIETHMGRQVSPDPKAAQRAARQRQRDASQHISRALAAGRSTP